MAGGWEDHALEAGEMITVGARAHQLRVVPLHAAQRSRGAKAMLTDFAADWFHPNDHGHRVWAGTFWSELKDSPALSAEPKPVARAPARR